MHAIKRMNKLAKLIFGIAVCMALLLFLLQSLNTVILRNFSSPNFIKTIVVLFFPPDDLYSDLAHVRLIKNSNNYIFNVSYSHIYTGVHALKLSVDDNKRTIEYFKHTEIKGSVSCVSGGDYSLTKNLKIESPYISKKGSGAVLWYYEVPNDLPLEGAIECNGMLEIPNDIFDRNFVSLRISKDSDL